MTDQQPHTPTAEVIRETYIGEPPYTLYRYTEEEFDRWLETIEAAAEQRGAVRALREAAESDDLIDHMYKHFDNRQAPAAVRATATYLHSRANQMEGDE